MALGEKLLELRRKKNLSQEEVAEKLGVTRQTISKWETNQTTPDFDKIAPLCNMYSISTDELLTGKKNNNNLQAINDNSDSKKDALVVSGCVFLYILSVIWIIISTTYFNMNEVLSVCIFLFIIGISTSIIIYHFMSKEKKKIKKELTREEKLLKQIKEVLSLVFCVIYFFISFMTMAWHITWIIWIIYSFVIEIIKLIFMLKGSDIHEE